MTDHAAIEQAMIEDLIGREPKRGALRRGWKLLPRVLPLLRPYRKFAIISVSLTFVLAAVALAEPWPLAFVVDSIVGDEPLPGWLPTIFGTGTGGLIMLAVAATLLLTLLSGGLTVLNEYLQTTVDQRMVLDFRSDMFEHAQKLSLAFHDTERKGVLMYRINNQAAALGQIVVSLPTLLLSVLTIVGMAYITFRINSVLALLALGITPFIAYSTSFYADRIEPRLYRVRGLGAINLSIVYEAMAMMRVVMAFGSERREFKRFRRQGEEWADATVDLTVRQTAFQLAVQLITSAGTAAVLGVGAYQAVEGHISAGELLVILSYITQIYTPLEQLTTTLTNFQQWFINMRMAFDLMDKEPEVKEKEHARAIERSRGEVEFDHVDFAYNAERDVLKDVSFKVPAGRAVAIVGPTGAGKSTLVSLMPRFYDVAEGRVLIDGVDVRDLTLRSLRSQFSVVLQEPLLFSDTIFENIRYGKLDASVEEVEEAAKAANAHDFITALPDGYQTVLGERGVKIAGGERQRIAVARAFLRDAPILVLDEPTSSIDSKTEAVILEALDQLMVGRTTIVIAHRLSTIRSVDEILVMQEGRLVQRGTHEELVETPGLYRELWEAQTRVSRGSRAKAPASAARELEVATAAATRLARSNGHGGSDGPPRREAGPLARGQTGGQRRPKIVLLGMMTKIPVGGVAWLVGQYVAGFERLGYEVYYVEAHARAPSMLMRHEHDDGTAAAVRFIAEVAEAFGFADRWAFQALHDDGRCFGMSPEQLDRLYRDADLIINMHGGTLPLPEHAATDRLVYLGTDPVRVELEVHRGDRRAIEFLEKHAAFFTWGLNFGNPDCALPWARPFPFVPSPPPVVLDFWDQEDVLDGAPYTTIGNWRQIGREVRFDGRTYRWSKHHEFLKILDLPLRARTPVELALESYGDADRLLLAEHGWGVRRGLEVAGDLDSYRDYILRSAGEVSVAKEQNVHFRSGWFSERSATYLAAGRPVVLQDTGFGNALPTGEGLFAFRDLDGAADAIAAIEADPARHRRAAREIAREHLSHEVVLGGMLDDVGLRPPRRRRPPKSSVPAALPTDLALEPTSQGAPSPPEEAASAVLGRPIPTTAPPRGRPTASVVVPVFDNLVCTRLALEGLLASAGALPYEVIVVDNGSAEPIRQYLDVLAARNRQVRVIRNEENRGFAAACNQGLAAAAGELLVMLSSDTIVPPGWLAGLARHLDNPQIGLVGPTTNRGGGAAEVQTSYPTYGEMVGFARKRDQALAGRAPVDLAAAGMFCAALRCEVFDAVGPLDARPEAGTFEDDYTRRVRDAGYRVVYVEALFVHRFGEGSPASLGAGPHPGYEAMARRVEAAVRRHVPAGSRVLVVSRGDEALMGFDGYEAWQFPPLDDGADTGQHPAPDEEAIAVLEGLRERGADFLVLPATSLWWLDRYEGVRRHLERYRRPTEDPETAVIYELAQPPAVARGEEGSSA